MGYSITIGVSFLGFDPVFSPGHVAVTVNTPFQQTYFGFGPLRDGAQWPLGLYAHGQFDVQTVLPGVAPLPGTHNFSTVLGNGEPIYFKLEGTESQAFRTDVWIYTQEQKYLLDQFARNFSRDYNEFTLGSDDELLVPSFEWN